MWISLGNVAEVALIFAQTAPAAGTAGLACFLVPTASEGFDAAGDPRQARPAPSDTASLASTRSRSPDEALIGEVGEGLQDRDVGARLGPYSVAAGCVGICEACVEASVGYATERRQFGVPIASFQLVQEMIADQIVRRGRGPNAGPPAPGCSRTRASRRPVETSVGEAYATESSVECANLAIQVHGGSGYVDDYPVERYLRDARVTTLYEGTSQIQKLIIGRDATGINAMMPADEPLVADRSPLG